MTISAMSRHNKMHIYVFVIILILAITRSSASGMSNGAGYSMYVWTTGFDRNITGCDQAEFLNWNTKGHCFSHTWDTVAKRQWLWDTCNVPGREISAIFLSGFHHILRDAYDANVCDTPGVEMVRHTLTEGHTKVPGLQIYGLFAVSDIAVSEQHLVKYIVYYNDHCARSQIERLDGVATNNEAYAGIKCADDAKRTAYLDNLQYIVVEAAKQRHGKLLTHYSVSWHWGQCNGGKSLITWHGKTQDANHHMIDIFDSVDVQVAYIIYPQISDRLRIAGYEYAKQLGKKIYATFYTNKASPCQISFFPQPCHVHGHTEVGLYKVIDSFSANGIDYAKPCIHYFRGVYSSGAHHDWPMHARSGTGGYGASISPRLFAVFFVFGVAYVIRCGKKVQVGKDQEQAQSEKDSHSKNQAHGLKTRDKYGIAKYIRVLEEEADARRMVRNKQSNIAMEHQNDLHGAKRNILKASNLEDRGLAIGNLKWLQGFCSNGCSWCCYIYKVITENRPVKVKTSSRD